MPHKSSAWQSIINQEDLKTVNDNFTKHCENPNHPFDQIVRYTHKNGSTVWIRCRGLAIRDNTGKPTRMLGAHQNVTELKRREEELYKAKEKIQESEEKYRAFYNNAPLSYQSLDDNGCFIDINPMWSKTLGYERDEVIGKWYGDFLHPDYVEHFRINFPAFKKRGYVSDVQFRLRRKDNSYIYVSYEGCVGYTPEGKFRQTYCVFKDITEQKALEFALIKAKERAEESERELQFKNEEIAAQNEEFTVQNEELNLANQKLMAAKERAEESERELQFKNEEYEAIAEELLQTNYELIVAKERAEESESKLKAALESMSDAVFISDTDGNFLEFNDAFATFHKFKNKQECAKTFKEYPVFLDVYFPNGVLAPIEQWVVPSALRGEMGMNKEFTLLRRDTNETWIGSYNYAPIRNNEGQIIGSVVTCRDITDIRLKENALRESETQYRNLANAGLTLIWTAGTDKLCNYFNEPWLKFTGRTLEQEMGNGWAEGVHPDDFDRCLETYISAFEKREAFNMEYRLKHESGEYRWILDLGTPNYNSKNEFVGYIGSCFDITERILAEEKLKTSDRIFKHSMDMLCIAGFDGYFKVLNPAWTKILGWSNEELLSKPWVEFVHPDDTDDTQDMGTVIVDGKEVYQFENRFICKDGSIKWLSWNSFPYPEENVMYGVARDVTERKLAEIILQGKNEEIAAQNEEFTVQNEELNLANQKLMAAKERAEKSERELQLKNEEYETITEELLQTNYELIAAKERAEESEFKLKEAQQIAHVGNWELSILPNKLVWSDEIFRIFDCEPQEFDATYEVFLSFIHPDDREMVNSTYLKSLQTKTGYQIEHRIITKNNQLKYVKEKCTTTFNEQGKPLSSVGIVIDITDSKLAEDELQKSEEKYRLLFENNPQPMWIYDLETLSFLEVNKEAVNHYGYSKEEFLSMTLKDIRPTEDIPALLENIRNILSGLNFDGAWRHIKKNGEIIDVEITSHSILFNDRKAQHILINDITERKFFEKELLKLSRAVEQSPASIIITDLKGNMEYVNPKTLEITGYTKDELIGKNPRIFSSGEKSKEEYKQLWSAISNGNEWIGEFSNKKKSGELYWESASISPILNERGEATHYLAVKEDITERKKILEELIKAKEHAEQSDRLKSAFLANMSHEIRTPMNGILGFAHLLKDSDLSGDEQQEYIGVIEKSGKRMLNIINDIVDISKIEAGLMESYIKEFNINEQLDYTYTFFKPETEAKGINLSFKTYLPNKEATITSDGVKVYAILTNLVKNSIKYTEKGSIEFGYNLKKESEHKQLEFFVKDTGIGIPKDRQEAIFERFIQADIADKDARQGAGLGLSIAKAYVEFLGGKIWVESEEGIGSTFYFTLPYNAEAATETIEQPLTAPDKSNDVRKLKIMIAEDDETSEILIEKYIKIFTKEILKVRTGVDAVETCRNHPDIDLILMDIQMPVMNGYDATRQIRQFNKEVIIIAQTAFGLSGDREKAIQAGCNDYVSKPIKLSELIEIINMHLSKSHLNAH